MCSKVLISNSQNEQSCVSAIVDYLKKKKNNGKNA